MSQESLSFHNEEFSQAVGLYMCYYIYLFLLLMQGMGKCMSQCLWGSEDSSQESMLSFYCQAQSRDLYL